MELHRIRGGNKADLENKKYNIGIGISLGNKWFTTKNTADLIKWSLKYTKDYVVVYVADSVHAINIEVRKRVKYERALSIALRQGTEIIENLKKEIQINCPENEKNKIKFIRWDDLINENYIQKRDFVFSFYKENIEFKSYINGIVKNHTRAEQKNFSEFEIERLSHYLLEELPDQTACIPYKDFIIEAYAYPFDGKFVELIEKIQNGEIFPEIKEQVLDTKPKVFLEVR